MTNHQADRIIRLAEQATDNYDHLLGIAYRQVKTDAETMNLLIEMLIATGDETVLTPDTVEWLEIISAVVERTLYLLSPEYEPDIEQTDESAED